MKPKEDTKTAGDIREDIIGYTDRTLYKEQEELLDQYREALVNPIYKERDMLVAALSKVFPSHLMRHPDSDTDWEDDWRWIVCIELPTGQATWHIHDSELSLFSHLKEQPNDWDGHTTEEKYHRLSDIDQRVEEVNKEG